MKLIIFKLLTFLSIPRQPTKKTSKKNINKYFFFKKEFLKRLQILAKVSSSLN